MFSETKRSQSIKLAQNYLFNKKLVSDLIKSIKICKEDIVFEVGPGRGIITEELLKYSNHIIAIEKDHKNIIELRKKEYNSNFITIIEGDILKYQNKQQNNYIVVSNPPFNITSALIKKFITDEYIPKSMYLVLQKEAFDRIAGIKFESQFSIIIKSLYKLKPIYYFKRSDFFPCPKVDTVFVEFIVRDCMKKIDFRKEYFRFVQYAFQQQKSSLFNNFKKVFSYIQWKKISQQLKFDIKVRVSDLSPDQWLQLFEIFKKYTNISKHELIMNAKICERLL
ncbi:MAG TPA: 16S rRNA (adenine(1518)-N(6)/adenine(1519)-N(6))-dimethyltransferase RsmA [bacterium]|nr:16S rRNA (adenine(1518)-N(6)/adenine(1519)-N(6))-dimethyltransferase RsmA [bacterium]